MEGRCPVVPHGHVLPYKIPKRSADVLEAERRAVIVAEQKRRGLSRSEAAAMIPGAEFLRQGKRARSQQTGEKNEYFKERQRTITSAAARTQSAARHEELLQSQRALQATRERVAVAAEKKAQLRAEQNDRHDTHLQRLEQALDDMPRKLQHTATAALRLAERAVDTAAETTEAAEKTASAAEDFGWTAKQLVRPDAGLIAGHVLGAGLKELQACAHSARRWAPVSEDFRPMISDQQPGLAALGDQLHAARMKVAAKKEAEREEGEIF